MKMNRVLSMVLVLSILIMPTLVYAEDDSRTATISEVSGNVQIMKAGGEKPFTAFTGMSLDEGDRIITGSDGAVTLEIDDDKEVKMDKNTQMSLSELRGSIADKDEQTGIGLIVGNIWSNIKKKLNIRAKYEIKTPTAVMGARGTMFGVRVTVTPPPSGSAGGAAPSVAVDVSVVEGVVSASIQQAVTNLVNQAVELQQLDVLLNHDQQISVNQTQPLNQQNTQVQQVTNTTLDVFTLENIRDAAQQNPQRVDPSLLNNINQVIQQMQQEEQQEEQQQQDQQGQQPDINNIQQDSVVTDSTNNDISDGGGNGSLTGSNQITAPVSVAIDPDGANTVSIQNNYGADDLITVSGLSSGDTIYAYNANNSLIGSGVAVGSAGPFSVKISIPQLGSGSGTVYLSRKQQGMDLESSKVGVNYPAEIIPQYWMPVGNPEFTSPQAANVSLSFDEDGNPYVAYADGSVDKKASVMSYDGSKWDYLGVQGFSTGEADYISVNRSPGVPYVIYSDADSDIGNKAVAMTYSGSGWDDLGGYASDSTSAMTSIQVVNGTPFVAFKDIYGVGVREYNTWGWSLGCDTEPRIKTLASSVGDVKSVSMDVYDTSSHSLAYIDSSDVIHLINDNDVTNVYDISAPLGGNPIGTAGADSNVSVFVDGDPYSIYVAYKDESNQIVVKHYNNDSSSKTWDTLGTIVTTVGAAQADISLFVDKGTPYVAYKDDATGKAMVQMYDGSSWIDLSNKGISEGDASSISLYVKDGIPYIAYTDSIGNLNDGVTVKELVYANMLADPLTDLSIYSDSTDVMPPFDGNTPEYDINADIYVPLTITTTSSGETITVLLNGSSSGVSQLTAGTFRLNLESSFDSLITIEVDQSGRISRYYTVANTYTYQDTP